MKTKKAFGFYATAVALVLAVVALVAVVINNGTAYFGPYGTNAIVYAATAISAVCALGYLALNKAGILGDVLSVCTPVAAMVAFMFYVNDRVAGIASVMTFEGNASTRADMTSALVGLVCMLLVVIVGIIASFCSAEKAAK